jgi:hypothetical protein
MATFAPLFESLLSGIFRQVASDYNLDYKEMMDRYTGKSSFAVYADSDQSPVEISVPVAKAPKPKAPKSPKVVKAKEPEKARMALSKMKKADFVAELEEQGIETEGLTVVKLKELVKEAREKSGDKPAKGKKPKEASPEPSPKKVKKAKKVKEPEPESEPEETPKAKKPKKDKKKKAKEPEPEPEPEPELEEEEMDDVPVIDPEPFEEDDGDMEAKNEADLNARLRAILAEDADGDETSDEEIDPSETQVLEEEPDSPGGVRAKMLRSQK